MNRFILQLIVIVASLMVFGVPAVFAGAVWAVTECTTIDASSEHETVQCDTASGRSIRLESSFHDDHGDVLLLSMTGGNSEDLLSMRIMVEDSDVTVEGAAGRTPFRWTFRKLGNGEWRSVHEWGDVRMVRMLREAAGTVEGYIVEGEEEEFFSATHWSRDWAAIDLLAEAAMRMTDRPTLAQLFILLTDELGQQVHPQRSPIGDYLDCLEDTCEACNGCWDGGCGRCEGDSLLQGAWIWSCYLAGAEMCMVKGITDLMAEVNGDPGPTF